MGKTLVISMVEEFFSPREQNGTNLTSSACINHKLFYGGDFIFEGKQATFQKMRKCECENSRENLRGKHPVLSLNFSSIKGANYIKIMSKFQTQIEEAYKKPNLDLQNAQFPTSLQDTEKLKFACGPK